MITEFFAGLTGLLQFSTRDFWTLLACLLIFRAFWSWRLFTVAARRRTKVRLGEKKAEEGKGQ